MSGWSLKSLRSSKNENRQKYEIPRTKTWEGPACTGWEFQEDLLKEAAKKKKSSRLLLPVEKVVHNASRMVLSTALRLLVIQIR